MSPHHQCKHTEGFHQMADLKLPRHVALDPVSELITSLITFLSSWCY
jgi:hypothetical protein